jgi:hypothetical protein
MSRRGTSRPVTPGPSGTFLQWASADTELDFTPPLQGTYDREAWRLLVVNKYGAADTDNDVGLTEQEYHEWVNFRDEYLLQKRAEEWSVQESEANRLAQEEECARKAQEEVDAREAERRRLIVEQKKQKQAQRAATPQQTQPVASTSQQAQQTAATTQPTMTSTTTPVDWAKLFHAAVKAPDAFDGKKSKFHLWWTKMEVFMMGFDGMDNKMRIAMVLSNLKGEAEIWSQVKVKEVNNGTIASWANFKQEMEERFTDNMRKEKAQHDIHNFVQGKM